MSRSRRRNAPGGARGHAPRPSPTPRAGSIPAAATRWTRWVAYAFIAAYTLYWAVQAFTVHRVGNYAVETDFYWKYGPAARDLTHGVVEIANYDSKGWGYPAVVAALSVLQFETFRAAQILALLAAMFSLLLLYRLHRSLFGPGIALAGVLLVGGNRIFLTNTYEVGTDLFFLAVSLASITLLLRSERPDWRAILASGLLAGWAFSTRYNGLVLWPGALALFLLVRVPPGPVKEQWRRAALWSGAFVLAALPWLWINAAHTGNPLTNSNYVNVGYAVYGEGNWEKFFYGGDRKIESFADVVRLDPGRFAGAMIGNVGEHLRRDLFELLGVPWGILAILGAILMALDRPGRRLVGYMIFGVLSFLSLVPVFYGARFSLPLLPFYAALATYPFTSPRVARAVAGIERAFPLRAFAFLAIWLPVAFSAYSWTKDPTNPETVSAGPYDLMQAIDFLNRNPEGPLLARKPHAAFLTGRRFVPLPDVANPDSLHAAAVRERAKYLLVSGIEFSTRPAVRTIAQSPTDLPGFRRVFESQGALVYEVVP